MTEYKGYLINKIHEYANGTADFELFAPHGEFGHIRPRTTLQKILDEIDEELEEQKLKSNN